MKYYQVKPESDQEHYNGKYTILVGKELYTENQIAKMKLSLEFIERHFLPLEVSRKGTHFFFGARFITIGFTPKYF